jgi:hypothetical protein
MPTDRHEALHLVLGFCREHGLHDTHATLLREAGMAPLTVRCMLGDAGYVAAAEWCKRLAVSYLAVSMTAPRLRGSPAMHCAMCLECLIVGAAGNAARGPVVDCAVCALPAARRRS